MVFDKFAIQLCVREDKSIMVSCKTREEVEQVLNEITSSKWFRSKDSGGEVIVQTDKIQYIRVIEYAGNSDDDDDEGFTDQGEQNSFW
ncbi:hypothetical protein NST33_20800 [Paenibacillus sp. FSL L8-0435]|uniref:hypothetical protein n=1 Tax=Paenibacillus sp. FSL L8-0435 TaxID=2954618 RepID=UPI0030DC1180